MITTVQWMLLCLVCFVLGVAGGIAVMCAMLNWPVDRELRAWQAKHR